MQINRTKYLFHEKCSRSHRENSVFHQDLLPKDVSEFFFFPSNQLNFKIWLLKSIRTSKQTSSFPDEHLHDLFPHRLFHSLLCFWLFFPLQESKMFSASSAPFSQSTRFCSTPPATRGSARPVERWKPSCSHLSTGECVLDSVAQWNPVTFHWWSDQVSRLWWLWVVIHTVNCCFVLWKRGYHLDWNAVLRH